MAATTVKVYDYSVYPTRVETVTLPGMPRTNEIFTWEENGQQHPIQNVIWCSEGDGSLSIQVN